MKDDVLTTTEAAKLLGISVRTAQLLIEGGRLPSWKTPGGHRRVHRSDVEAMLPSGRTREGARSATVLVVTNESRRPRFEAVFERIGHVMPQIQVNIWAAATAVAGRLPAAVVVDIEAWGSNGTGLLETLAHDGRFKQADLVAVVPASRRGTPAPAGRVCETSLDHLEGVLKELAHDEAVVGDIGSGEFPVAPNEASRLLAVQRSRLVDTPSEAPLRQGDLAGGE